MTEYVSPHIFGHNISILWVRFAFKILSPGGSVAKARAAKVSMIKLIQSIYTALSGESFRKTDPKKTIARATTLIVS